MYRRSKFIETLHEIRQEMAAEADYDTVLFAEMVRSGEFADASKSHSMKERPPTASDDEVEVERAGR